MSSRKRKLDLLPSFDEMHNELESEKLVVKKFMKYHKKIVGLSLDQGESSLSKVDENDKATWLIATCGFDTVANCGDSRYPVIASRNDKAPASEGDLRLHLATGGKSSLSDEFYWKSVPFIAWNLQTHQSQPGKSSCSTCEHLLQLWPRFSGLPRVWCQPLRCSRSTQHSKGYTSVYSLQIVVSIWQTQ